MLVALSLTHPERSALPVVTSKMQDALRGHGKASVLGQTRHPVLVFVQVLLKPNTNGSLQKIKIKVAPG